jgi:hypothetical protein
VPFVNKISLQRDKAVTSLQEAVADNETEVVELKEQIAMLQLRSAPTRESSGSTALRNQEIDLLRRKLDEKDRLVKDSQGRCHEAESRYRALYVQKLVRKDTNK